MDINKYIQARKAENEAIEAKAKKSFWQRLKDVVKFDVKNTEEVLSGKKSLLQAIKDRNKQMHNDMIIHNKAYREGYSAVQGIKDALKDKVDEKVASSEVLSWLKENIKDGIKETSENNEKGHRFHKYDMSQAVKTGFNGKEVYMGARKESLWERFKNVVTGKKSAYAAVRDNVKDIRTVDSNVRGAVKGIAKTLRELRVAKPGKSAGLAMQNQQKEQSHTQARIVSICGATEEMPAEKPQERQVQVNSDLYHALESYAYISAIEEMSGISGFSYKSADKNRSLDVLKQASPTDLQQAVGQFKANTQKNPAGNADFSSKVSDAAEKLPEQLEKDKQYGLAINRTMSPAAQSLQDVFDNVRHYKDANAYDSSESGQAIYAHKNKDFISDMQKIVDIYKANPNDGAVCGLLRDNLSLLTQAAVSASSHQEVDKMSEFMFQLGKELQTNSSISSENKAKVYEGLANMTNYEGENGRHYNAFTNSSMYKNSLYELMEKTDSKDKDMFYSKLTDKKLFEYSINYEKAPERIQPQKQMSVSLMKGLKREVYN